MNTPRTRIMCRDGLLRDLSMGLKSYRRASPNTPISCMNVTFLSGYDAIADTDLDYAMEVLTEDINILLDQTDITEADDLVVGSY